MWSQLTTFKDSDGDLGGIVRRSRDLLDGPEDGQALNNAAKDHVLAIQMRGRVKGDEELAAVGVGPRVGHREQARSRVAKLEALVLESRPVDRPGAGAVALEEVPRLHHEPGDQPEEPAALEALRHPLLPHLSRAQASKVLGSARHHVCEQLELDPPDRVCPQPDVKEHHRVGRVERRW